VRHLLSSNFSFYQKKYYKLWLHKFVEH